MHFYAGCVHDAECTKNFSCGAITRVQNGESAHASMLLWDIGDSSASETRQSVRVSGSGGVGSRANKMEAKSAAKLAVEIAEVINESSVAILTWYNNQVG